MAKPSEMHHCFTAGPAEKPVSSEEAKRLIQAGPGGCVWRSLPVVGGNFESSVSISDIAGVNTSIITLP